MKINKKTLTMGFIVSVVCTIIIGGIGDHYNSETLTYLSLVAAGSFSFYALFIHKGWFQ